MEIISVHQQYINELSAAEMKAINLLSTLYEEEQKWPTERAFRQKLKQDFGKKEMETVLARLSPGFLFCNNPGGRDAHYELSLAGMCAIEESIFDLVCKYFDFIKETYRKDPDTKVILSEELQTHLQLTEYELLKLRICIYVGGLWGDSASGLSKEKSDKNQNWSIGLYRDIENLDDAKSSEVYLKQLLYCALEKSAKPIAAIPFIKFHTGRSSFEELLHPKVIDASLELFTNKHYSDAAFRSVLALEKEVQAISKTNFKGADLMSKAFNSKNPLIKFNKNQTESDVNEQDGLMHMFRGAIQSIRNLHAHENFKIDELESKRIMVLTSFLFNKLDSRLLEVHESQCARPS